MLLDWNSWLITLVIYKSVEFFRRGSGLSETPDFKGLSPASGERVEQSVEVKVPHAAGEVRVRNFRISIVRVFRAGST